MREPERDEARRRERQVAKLKLLARCYPGQLKPGDILHELAYLRPTLQRNDRLAGVGVDLWRGNLVQIGCLWCWGR